MTHQEIIDALAFGADADIWYDPHVWGDEETDAIIEIIERTQQAMIEAARLIKEMKQEDKQ
jgi:hypothetical protein